MATRSDRDLQRLHIVTRTVITGAVAKNMPIKPGATEHTVQPTTDGVSMTGVVYELGPLAGAVGDQVQIVHLSGGGVIPVKVGTGGATEGSPAKVVATGFTNGTTGTELAGYFTQTGVAGDIVGMVPARSKTP